MRSRLPRGFFAAGLAMLAACTPAPAPAPAAGARTAATPASPMPPAPMVCLQPLGSPDKRLFAPIESAIVATYGLRVRLLDGVPLPRAAWYAPRARYRAEKLLDFLRTRQDACDFVLGLTEQDVSTSKGDAPDWGVLGLAYRQQKLAVVSTFRMRRGVDHAMVARRAVKVSLHELGHAIGLPHRNDGPECLMNDARGAVASIDRARGTLCEPERLIAEAFLHRPVPHEK